MHVQIDQVALSTPLPGSIDDLQVRPQMRQLVKQSPPGVTHFEIGGLICTCIVMNFKVKVNG